jgi:hypothetical protein
VSGAKSTVWPPGAKVGAGVVASVAALGLLIHLARGRGPASVPATAITAGVAPSALTTIVNGGSPPPPTSVAPPIPAKDASGSAPGPGVPAMYGTHVSLRLAQATHGVDGTLRVLEDTRARRPGVERPVPMRDEPGWLHARLELLDAAGHPVDAYEEWTSLADVREVSRESATRGSFLVTLDPECFASVFCGKDTEIVDVRAGKLAWVSSVDAETRKKEPIRLRDSVMEGWRLSPAGQGKAPEIFQVTSRRTPKGDVTAYVRYTLEGDAWVKRYKQRVGADPPGNPGNEEAAFDRSKFPALPEAAGN